MYEAQINQHSITAWYNNTDNNLIRLDCRPTVYLNVQAVYKLVLAVLTTFFFYV